jgi:hypothetical protein
MDTQFFSREGQNVFYPLSNLPLHTMLGFLNDFINVQLFYIHNDGDQ